MKIENLLVGMVLKNYKELCALLEIEVKEGNSKKSQLKEMERYFKYHKEGNKFIIDEIYGEAKEKVDGRGKSEGSRANNTGKYKYYEEAKNTILFLLKDKEEGTRVQYFAKKWLVNMCAVGENFHKVEFDNGYINERYIDLENKIKGTVLKGTLEKMKEEELITYDKKCLMVEDENGKERRAFVDEQVDYEKWEEEVLAEMGYEKFLDLKKASFGNHLMDKFNRLMYKRYHEKYGWKKTRMYIEVTKRTQLKGKDMRKEINKKVVDEYKNSLVRKNKRRLEEFREKIYESKVNKGREEKLIAERFIPYEDEFSEILTADHMYKASNNTKSTRRSLYNTPPIDMEWFREMLDKDFPAPKEVIDAMDEELDLLFDTKVFEIKDFDEIVKEEQKKKEQREYWRNICSSNVEGLINIEEII